MNKIEKWIKAVKLFNLLEDNYSVRIYLDYDIIRIYIDMPNEKMIPLEVFYDKLPNWTKHRIIKWLRELINDYE